MRDDRGLSFSIDPNDAAMAYETALFAVNGLQGDPITVIDDALVIEPDFIRTNILVNRIACCRSFFPALPARQKRERPRN